MKLSSNGRRWRRADGNSGHRADAAWYLAGSRTERQMAEVTDASRESAELSSVSPFNLLIACVLLKSEAERPFYTSRTLRPNGASKARRGHRRWRLG
jgi:hypothetical protein